MDDRGQFPDCSIATVQHIDQVGEPGGIINPLHLRNTKPLLLYEVENNVPSGVAVQSEPLPPTKQTTLLFSLLTVLHIR